nr:immunoglobulin heavy chain junction region [Mus musculus]
CARISPGSSYEGFAYW